MRISTALATLLLLALSLPAFVIAQQGSTKPTPPTARRGELGRGTETVPVDPSARTRRTRPAATEGLEADVSEALTVIQDNYVDGNKVNYNDVFKSSIIGMLRTLDPHSNFYDAKEFEEQRADWRSEYYGIGATIGDRRVGASTDTYILATFEATPAFRAGLRFGDRVTEIDGKPVKGKASGDVRDMLRGPRGTTVRVTVERASNGATETVEITRDAVPQPTVPDAYFIKPGVGYIDMTRGFNYTTAEEFISALDYLRSRGMTGLVVDLRGNGGGILDQAVRVAEQFLASGQTILTQKGRGTRGEAREFKSENRSPDNTPLVVLVNRGTASASEIVAGAWQDHDRALIVGETSFGKGLVQSIMPLEYGTALTLTTSKYYTPSGRLIQRDYSNQSFYDYIYGRVNGTQAETQAEKPKGPETHTDTGRPLYGGGGISPDETIKPRTLSAQQVRLIDPVFAFARDMVNGRVAGFPDYKVAGMPDFERNVEAGAFVVDDRVFKAFKEYVAAHAEDYKVTDAQLDHSRDFIARQLRYDLTTAAYGSVKATQVLMLDDPQVTKGIDSLPRARDLATSAMRGRNPQTKSFE
ncbi:MAG: carboxyl-terminal processing protease [Acidobacteriota bacterium]|jgi:carboxyl-terminal processing protease|nr:carboxyl-terminal processing protease [Acidobacteriota bacterium]